MVNTFFDGHSHTEYSNLRLLDSINKPAKLIKTALNLGLSGIAITDHECLSAHPEVNQLMETMHETNPDFTIALGNEIYLTDTRDIGQKYYHFILIAKDAIGHRALRELSSTAWFYSYVDRRMERVPTLKTELIDIINRFPGHLIATSACLGGELPTAALAYERATDLSEKSEHYAKITNFLELMLKLFKDDFYIEIAPAESADQLAANKILYNIAQAYNIKITLGCDAHYLRPEDRMVHQSYLNSKDGDREVADFYEYAHLFSPEEARAGLKRVFDDVTIDQIFNNTLEIKNKIQYYSLFHKQDVPFVEVKDYPKKDMPVNFKTQYPLMTNMFVSDDMQNRYWINQCFEKLTEMGKSDDKEYLDELEEETRVKGIISEKLETNMFRYPNTLQHYIDLIWDCGSIIGAGRGSSCAALNHYLLGITQLDPIRWKLPFFRYLNDERIELGDIDIDICPSKRPLILQKIKEERGHLMNSDIPQWAKDNLGCTLVAAFGTETTKSCILTSCRGYRSEDYPEGIDVDIALYIASLIPSERGFLWSVNDVVNGNAEKGRKPVKSFLDEVAKYPGLLDIIIAIEGTKNKRSSHASGVILFSNDPFEHCAFMKTPSGDLITQFDLHTAEWLGNVKYDFLVTEACDKLVQTMLLLQDAGEIEKDLSIREIYNKYFHPEILPIEDEKCWDALDNVSVLNTFQFDSLEGSKTAKLLRPRSMQEMSSANGLMRLLGAEGEERPIDKYKRQKDNIQLWYNEMDEEGLTKAEQETIKPYFEQDYGVPPDQESLMLMLMDKNICGFSLGEANAARKVVAKKKMDKIEALHQQVLNTAKSEALGKYIWRHGVGPQVGYAFSRIHALAYSFIGFQTLYIATHWNPIYWNTACLIVNSASLEADDELEDDDDKAGSTDYAKIAKAIGEIRAAGIEVHLVDINKSKFSFAPDVENNAILFGLKAMLNINDDTANMIIANRPYVSPKDFLYRVKPNKQTMISLIKGGAFDNMMERRKCMAWYLWETCDKKSNLTMNNMPTLIKYDLIPKDNDALTTGRRIFEFNRYLKAICKYDTINFKLDDRALEFLSEINYPIDGELLNMKIWDKYYQKQMDVFRNWMSQNKAQILDDLNFLIFKADWEKYALGSISAWEMTAVCFYYHEHELAHVNKSQYGIVDFDKLPEEPEIECIKYIRNKPINIFKLVRICGTCIAKNKTKGIVTLLTTSGVVNVKFRKEYFALFDRQISAIGEDGKKHVVESSWFKRGNKIMVLGIRSGDTFVVKKYANSIGHQLYKINTVSATGELTLQSERAQGEAEDEEI